MRGDGFFKLCFFKILERKNGVLSSIQDDIVNFVLQGMASGHQQVAGNVPGLKNFSADNTVHGFSKQDDILKFCKGVVARGQAEQNNISPGAGGGNCCVQSLVASRHFKGDIDPFSET